MTYSKTLLFVLIIAGISCKPQGISHTINNKEGNSLLWKVEGANIKPLYIYGTFHLLCKKDIVINEITRKAISEADKFYFELDMDDPASMLGPLLFMNMQKDSSLDQFLSVNEISQLQTYFDDSLKMPFAAFQRMKPFLLSTLFYPSFLGCNSYGSVEEALVKIITASNKEILGLETVEEQMSIFDVIPYSVQARSLMDALDSLETYRSEFALLVNAYKKQQLYKLNEVISRNDDPLSDYNSLMLDDRNKKWITKISDQMRNNKLFIAVGAGHLPGENGLINLFRKAGYSVSPVL